MTCLFKWKMLFWVETAIHKAVCWKYLSARELPLCRSNAWGFPVTGRNPERSKAATLLSWEMKKKKKKKENSLWAALLSVAAAWSQPAAQGFILLSQQTTSSQDQLKPGVCWRLCNLRVWLLLMLLSRSTNGAAGLWPVLPSYELALPLKST